MSMVTDGSPTGPAFLQGILSKKGDYDAERKTEISYEVNKIFPHIQPNRQYAESTCRVSTKRPASTSTNTSRVAGTSQGWKPALPCISHAKLIFGNN